MSRARIFVAGGRGMVGGAICRAPDAAGCENVLVPGRGELDLCDQLVVQVIVASRIQRAIVAMTAWMLSVRISSLRCYH